MKEKEQDVCLGDIISSSGLAGSVEATIAQGSIYETAAILRDWWMQCVGGMIGAWDILEMSIIPSLLANFGIWVEISQKAIDTLDGLQELYCSLVYSCPSSTPKPSLRGEAGLLDMSHRI